jgi:hypothetical protein
VASGRIPLQALAASIEAEADEMSATNEGD